MGNINYLLFICVAVPILLMLFVLEKKSKITMGYMLIGIFSCLFISEINGFLLQYFKNDVYYVTTTITPVTEEIIKALPVLYFAFLFSDKRETLISLSIATGIGFAVLENLMIFMNNVEQVNLLWAAIRGFSSGLMHGLCTAAVGIGLSFVHKKKKLFVCGTFALLIVAITYHSIYNTLIQSQYQIVGAILPMATYIPVLFVAYGRKIFKKEKKV
ncbi:MAG: PrsW family intramembrane metalloprotease [Clostridia bacterium]|nr:PrsW family intramembrane metalloprotease [Clostridia bacterium]